MTYFHYENYRKLKIVDETLSAAAEVIAYEKGNLEMADVLIKTLLRENYEFGEWVWDSCDAEIN